jgi:outer membrane protein, multidrug efflux system
MNKLMTRLQQSLIGRGTCVMLGCLLLGGCRSMIDYTQPDGPAYKEWTQPAETGELPYWNQLLSDPQLDALITEALERNSDLRIAAQRVELARAQFQIQRSEQLPNLNGVAGYQSERRFDNTNDLWNAVLAVPSWEIDLWGRVAALTESAQQRFLAVEANRRAVEVSLTAQVAGAYLNLLALDAQIVIAEETLRSREKSQRIIEDRKEAGIASGLDRRQANILSDSARRTLDELRRLQSRQENGLAILLGRVQGPISRASTLLASELPPQLPAGLPSALLERRPDLQAAEAQLRAADLDVFAARKAFLPAFSITGSLGLISSEFEDLLDDEAWSVAPAAALPIFNAGRLRANLSGRKAQQTIAAETYLFAIRNAYREVENALGDHHSFRRQAATSATIVNLSQERLDLTEQRYREGVSSYFEVLDANRELFANQLDRIRSQQAALTSVVELYRAVAADWLAPVSETTTATDPAAAPCPVCGK